MRDIMREGALGRKGLKSANTDEPFYNTKYFWPKKEEILQGCCAEKILLCHQDPGRRRQYKINHKLADFYGPSFFCIEVYNP